MAGIKCKSVKAGTLVILETHIGKSGAPIKSQEAIVEDRVFGKVALFTDDGPLVLETASVDATIFTDPARSDVTFRLRTVDVA